jgi:hypothetical protein
VSPLQYWLNSPANYKPKNDDDASRAMMLGKARHKCLLEGREAFLSSFACKPSRATHPNALVTTEDITSWIASRNVKPVRGSKSALIEQAKTIDPTVEILDVLAQEQSNDGRVLLPADDYLAVLKSAEAFEGIRARIGEGLPEVTLVWDDPELGVKCKARLDWIGTAPEGHCRIVELKDFANQGRKTSLKARTDQVFGFERHDIDVMFQCRAWRHTPKVAHWGNTTFSDMFLDGLDKLPEFPPQDHPEMMVLYCRKDSEIAEFIPRTVQLCDQSGALTETGSTAWTSILNAADTYRENVARYGFEKPWFSKWHPAPVEFSELPGSYQYL